MKQHISKEELLQLNPEQQEKLRAWWKSNIQTYDVGCYEFGRGVVVRVIEGSESMHLAIDNDLKMLPLLSIGQCIELLHEFVKERDNNRLMIWEMVNHPWNVEALDKDDSKWGEEHIWIQDKEELIDALFEAVKSIL
jgi:hypothetical protein